MVIELNPAGPVRFGEFQLDLRNAELRRGPTLIKLQPQPAKVLVLLVSRAGQTVSRQELVEGVWGAETFVDFEQGLNFAIRQVRATLEDERDSPRFIETVPKRGYRFIAPVVSAISPDPANTPIEAANEIAEDVGTGATAVLWQKWLQTVAVVCFLCLIGILAVRYLHRKSAPKFSSRSVQSIAVLPLVNLSADPEQEYFSQGLTDELIMDLAKIGTLRVVSHTSVVAYEGTKKTASAIGNELHVDAIVEGTVERLGERVRIRAQLIHAATDQHLWAESYDRDTRDLLQLEGEVAQDIAEAVGRLPEIRGDQIANSRQVSASVHEDYLKGRYYWNKRTEAGLRKGVEHFQRAIEQDPKYAPAYAGIADSYIMLANWGFMPPREAYPKAKAAALKALELDEELAEAHTSLAYTTLLYEWDWNGAEKEFRRAIALNPNYVSAHHFYSVALMTAGRQAEALTEIRRAQELDPLSLIVNDVVGWIYYEGRQYDAAVGQYKKTLEMEPNYVPALLDLGVVYLKMGDFREAITQFGRARTGSAENGVTLSALAQAYALSGNKAAARGILHRLEQPSAAGFVSPWDLSLIYTALGDKKRAIQLLQRAADERVGWVVRLGVDPAFDSLRAEPEFQQLVRRIHIPSTPG